MVIRGENPACKLSLDLTTCNRIVDEEPERSRCSIPDSQHSAKRPISMLAVIYINATVAIDIHAYLYIHTYTCGRFCRAEGRMDTLKSYSKELFYPYASSAVMICLASPNLPDGSFTSSL